MKIAALATVKDQFSAYVQESQTSPVIITKNGKPVALFTGIRDEDDLDSLLLANNPRFLQILEEARQRTRQTGGVKIRFLEERRAPPQIDSCQETTIDDREAMPKGVRHEYRFTSSST